MGAKWLILVLGVALLVRVVGLGVLPPGFAPDEASFGYDAWSILTTGRDQWGRWPWVLKSFGDYKSPLYAFLCMPFVAVMGLTEVVVRLPNALLSVAAVAVVYLLAAVLTRDKRVGLVVAGLVAISPWEVMLGRGGFEANLTVFFLPLAVWGLMRARRDGRWWILVGVAGGANLLSYHAAKLVTLPVLAIFVWGWRKEFSGKGRIWGGVALGLGLAVLVGQQWAGGGRRAVDVSILSPDDGWRGVAERRFDWVKQGVPDVVARGFANKMTYVLEVGGENYWSYFSPEFLFTNGAGEGTYGMIPGVGLLYPIEAIFLLAFGVGLAKGKMKGGWWLVVWLLVAAVPAALSKGPGGAANRTVVMMPAWQIMSGWGAVYLWGVIGRWKWRRWVVAMAVAWTVWVGIGVAGVYMFEGPKRVGESMLYGRREAMEYISRVYGGYDKVVVSRRLSEPQIYVAFYLKVPPRQFQEASRDWKTEEAGVKFLDQLPIYRLGRYEFRTINWESDRRLARVLLVGTAEEIPDGVRVRREIRYPNGEVAIRIAESEGERIAER